MIFIIHSSNLVVVVKNPRWTTQIHQVNVLHLYKFLFNKCTRNQLHDIHLHQMSKLPTIVILVTNDNNQCRSFTGDETESCPWLLLRRTFWFRRLFERKIRIFKHISSIKSPSRSLTDYDHLMITRETYSKITLYLYHHFAILFHTLWMGTTVFQTFFDFFFEIRAFIWKHHSLTCTMHKSISRIYDLTQRAQRPFSTSIRRHCFLPLFLTLSQRPIKNRTCLFFFRRRYLLTNINAFSTSKLSAS